MRRESGGAALLLVCALITASAAGCGSSRRRVAVPVFDYETYPSYYEEGVEDADCFEIAALRRQLMRARRLHWKGLGESPGAYVSRRVADTLALAGFDVARCGREAPGDAEFVVSGEIAFVNSNLDGSLIAVMGWIEMSGRARVTRNGVVVFEKSYTGDAARILPAIVGPLFADNPFGGTLMTQEALEEIAAQMAVDVVAVLKHIQEEEDCADRRSPRKAHSGG